MIAYAVIMFLASALLLGFGVAIYRGKTELIHSYHQTKVRDKRSYGRAFGKALFVMALAPLISGAVGLCADSKRIAMAAVAVLILGMGIGTGYLIAVQRKYNQGVF